ESPGGARSGGGDELCLDQPPVVASHLEPAAGGHVRSDIYVGPLSAAAVNAPGGRRSRHVGVAANPRSQIAKSLWLDLRSNHHRPYPSRSSAPPLLQSQSPTPTTTKPAQWDGC